LQGTSAAALSTMLPGSAFAVPVRVAVPAVAAAPVTAATPFNGGRSQVGMVDMLAGGGFPFLNCLKTAQSWAFMDSSGYPAPSTLDSNGYPISISNTGVYTVFYVPSQAERPGNYVITWSGNGTIFCGMSNTPVSGSKTSNNGSGRYVFSTTDSRFALGITAVGNPYITNLQVFHVNDEAALNAGQVFGQQFIARLKQANFGVIRFMGWQGSNTSNVTTWATRKPVSYWSYVASQFPASIYAGVTQLSGTAYSVPAPSTWSGLVDKAMVTIQFGPGQSLSSACTLNVGGTGNINILSEYGNALSSGGNSFPVGGSWMSIATLVYDATLNAWIKQGGDIASGSTGISNGCPLELMVQLCAQVGAHPHFVAPMLAVDPATDFIPSLAAYCRANGPSWMIPRFEGPNECWNYAAYYYATQYAAAKAAAYGWGADVHNWYGKIMSVLGQAVSAAYGADRTKYQVLCGVQTGMGFNDYGTGSCNDRLASTKYLAQSTAPQLPYTMSPASKWVTHICTAQYYTPSEYGTAQETTDAAAYVAAAGNPNLQSSIAAAYASTSNSGSGGATLSQIAIWQANWKIWALSFGITKMCGYEGGYSPDFNSGGVSQIDQLRAASKLAPALNGFTTINYNNFVGLTDSSFTAEFPSAWFSGSLPVNEAWSTLDDIYESPNSPQWTAIMAFNSTSGG
jgi:hypothetical protein